MTQTSESREVLERLNALWRVAGAPPAPSSLPRSLLYRVRLLVARLLAPQETFNATVVQYLNTGVNAIDEARIAAEEATRYRESLAARERRIEATAAAILAGHEEIRTAIGTLQQATQALKREVARLGSGVSATPAAGPVTAGHAPGTAAPAAFGDPVESGKYLGFEDQFRGSPDEIRSRLEEYLPLFAGASNVLDVGCGRGEFLALLREQGISATGVDSNASMADACRARGLDAEEGDALGYLAARRDESLGGIFAAQVVEHFEPAYLLRFLDVAFDKLRPGAPIVLETINPACWFAFFSSYIRDITHAQPVHPDTLKYLLVAGGFQQVEVRFRSPYPAQHKLQPVAPKPSFEAWAETLNENAEKLNGLLFTHLDYAAVGRRP